MYENIIKNYVNKLTKDHIKKFCIKENITISNEEINIIYYYIKNNWKDIMYNPNPYLKIAKEKLNKDVYEKLLVLKDKYLK
jgi:biotin synthase-related radical SAM superfamily protein